MKDKSLTYKLNIVKNYGNLIFNLSRFLKINSGNGYDAIYKLVKSKPQGDKIITAENIASHKQLWDVSNNNIPVLPFEKSLIWNLVLIKNNIGLINSFIKDKCALENLIFNGAYDEACELLDKIDDDYCCSIWSLETRLLIEKLSGNPGKDLELNDNVLLISDLLKIKVDVHEQGARYQKKVKDLVLRMTKSEALRAYLFFKTGVTFELNKESAQAILMYESANSIIDIFLTTQHIILNLSENIKNNRILGQILTETAMLFEDKSLKCVSDIIFNSKTGNSTGRYAEILNCFNKNDFNEFIRNFQSNKKDYITNIHLIYLYIISLISAGYEYEQVDDNGNLGDRIIKRLFLYLTQDKIEGNNSIAELDAICRICDSCYSGKELRYLFNKFFKPNPTSPLSVMTDEAAVELKDYFSGSANRLINIYYSEPEEYSDILQEAEAPFDGNEKLRTYMEMVDSYMYYYHYLDTCKFDDALNVLIWKYVSHNTITHALNITEITRWLEEIKYDQDVSIQKLIYINEVDDFKDLQTSAFLNFLDCNDLTEPLDVLKIEDIESELKKFYLEKICTMENLSQLYSLFERSDEVEEYRIKICKKLIEISDGDEKNALEEEISNIYRQINKRQKLSKLNEGKLSVDFEAVGEAVLGEMNNLFRLYKATPENLMELYQSGDLFIKELQTLIESHPGVKIYVSKRSRIVKEMYENYLKEFCFGKNGLDIYLSTRIRHGAFSNQIMKVFMAHEITNDSLSKAGKGKAEELISIYSEIEDTINDIIQNKLKVNYENDNSSAIFNYYDDDLAFYDGAEKMISKSCVSAEACLFLFEDLVIYKTNEFLRKIKNDLLISTHKKFSISLDKLLFKAKEIVDDNEFIMSLEKNINDCNVELKEVMEKISDWFVISQDRSWPDFSFSELTDLCCEIGKSLNLNFEKAEINKNVDDCYMVKGKYFKHLNDIFVILQNNAFAHSGFDNKKDLKINIEIFINANSQIEILFCNNLNLKTLNINEIEKNIKIINKYFENGSYTDSHLHKEGGTGLLRTINMLFYILQIGETFKVQRVDDIFEVHIILKREVLNEENIAA